MVPVRPRNQGVKIPGLCSVPADRSASLCRPAGEAAPVALPEPSCSKVPKMTTQPPLDREAAHQGRGLVHGGELREAIAQGGRRRLSRSGFRLSDSPNISAPSLAFANWWHHSVKQRSRVMSSSSPMRRASKIGACWRAAWASAQFKSSPLSPQSFSSSGMGLQSQSRTRMGRPPATTSASVRNQMPSPRCVNWPTGSPTIRGSSAQGSRIVRLVSSP
jgi:hypothetical protein